MTNGSSPSVEGHRRGLLLPLLVVALGATVFAVQVGLFDPDTLHALAHVAWPVLLVLIGVELLHARYRPYLALALEALVVLTAAVAFVLAQPDGVVTPAGHEVVHLGHVHD